MSRSQLLTEEVARLVVERRLARDDFRILETTDTPLDDEEVTGVMSEQSRLAIKVEVDSNIKTLNFFTKYLPRRLHHRAGINTLKCLFAREVSFYRRLGPLYVKVDTCFPRCYYVGDDLIVLEDLSEAGFRILDQVIPFDYNHCAVALTTLARFHSATLDLDDAEFTSIKPLQNYAESLTILRELTALAELVTGDKMDVATLHSVIRRAHGEAKSVYVGEQCSVGRHVMCHFDLWTNNIMFAYDADGRPIDARLVDFQQSMLLDPAFDISMLLHMTTSASFRKQHQSSLMNLYWERLGRLIPKSELEDLYHRISKSVSAIAFFYGPSIFLPRRVLAQSLQDDGDSFDTKQKVVTDLFQRDECFRTRVSDVINTFLAHYAPERDALQGIETF